MFDNIVIILILLVLSGFFSGAEIALVSVSKIKVRMLLNQKRRGARSLYKLKKNPERMIVTILIGNNIVNVAAAAMATVIATEFYGSAGLGIATGAMTLLILVFGEITPKTFAATHAEGISLIIARPILYFSYVIYPIIIFFEHVSKFMMKLLRSEGRPSSLTEEELKTMIEVSAEKDIIDVKEKEILESVLEFNDIRASEVMTPKTKVFSLDGNITVKQSVSYITRQTYSRIPVFAKNRDNIIGVVHIRDVLASLDNRKQLKDIAFNPVLIHESLSLNDIFRVFQLKQAHMAIVVDDNKKFLGILTLEDLMEELVGEIMDEKDLTPTTIVRIDRHTIIVHGKTSIEKVNRFFNIDLPVMKNITDMDELMRFKLTRAVKGSKIKLDNVTLFVDEVEAGEISKIRITKEKKLFERLDDHLKKR